MSKKIKKAIVITTTSIIVTAVMIKIICNYATIKTAVDFNLCNDTDFCTGCLSQCDTKNSGGATNE